MTAPVPPDPRRLALATLGAALVALLVLVVAVLPAEYGIDPTGVGEATGFKRLSDATPGEEPGVEIEDDGVRTVHALEARWEVVEFPVASQSGYSARDGGDVQVKMALNLTNLTTLTAHLRWNDTDRIDGQTTGPDTFEISIRAPQGKRSGLIQGDNEPGGEGNISTTLAWRSLPAPRTASDGYVLPLHEPDASSRGEWTFVVRLYAARGLAGGADLDPGNGWNLTITAETYELAIDETEGSAGDRVTLTLAPGRALEYKFHLLPEATMQYRWTSTAPVSWDLHAEEDGQNHDAFTPIQTGTSQGEQGSVAAAFSGRYGWYFHNRGDAPLTIALETTGEYRILGVV